MDPWQNIVEESPTGDCLKKYNLDDEHIRALVGEYESCSGGRENIAKMSDRSASVYEQYKNGRSLNIKDMDLVRDILLISIRIIWILLKCHERQKDMSV